MAKTEAILATVVHVEGSSYRRAGARMLVDELGNITGAISGGCLEGDALRKALLAMHQRKNKLVTYDTSDEDDAVIGAQLGCNGIIQVLFEPIDFENAYNACEMLQKAVDSDKKQAIVIGFNLDRTAEQPGTILLIDEETITHGMHISAEQLEILKHEAKLVLQGNDSQFVEFEEASEVSQFYSKLPAARQTDPGRCGQRCSNIGSSGRTAWLEGERNRWQAEPRQFHAIFKFLPGDRFQTGANTGKFEDR